MKRTLTLAVFAALALSRGDGQSAAKGAAFEVASITPCKPGTPAPAGEHTRTLQFTYPGGRFQANATTVKYLLEWAYGIQPNQHSGGPSWVETERYDIAAKAEGGATDDQMKLMTQTLLRERFKLMLHHETRKLSALVISAGKTAPRLFPAKDGETHAMRFETMTGPDQKAVTYHVIATRFSLAQLTGVFAQQLEMVIVDQTGFKGEYDFTIDLTPNDTQPNPMDAALLLTAMREQLGLTVKSQEVPVDFLAIDSAERVTAETERRAWPCATGFLTVSSQNPDTRSEFWAYNSGQWFPAGG